MDNTIINQDAYKFLLFSCFGSTEPTIEDFINRAYRDLCRTLSGIALEEIKLKDCSNENKEDSKEKFDHNDNKTKWKNAITEIIENAIKKTKDIQNQADFDAWHQRTCNKIIASSEVLDKILGKDWFTYGHAQKWLNMTLKYQMLFGREFNSNIKEFMHVPVDSFIMEAASGFGVMTPYKTEHKNDEGKYSESNSLPWSKWEECHYTKFQKELRKKIAPKPVIEWEAGAWIKVAKNRTSNDQNKKQDKINSIEEALKQI